MRIHSIALNEKADFVIELSKSPTLGKGKKQKANEIFNAKNMPHDWKTSTVVYINIKKGSYRGVELLEHEIKRFKRLLKKRLKRIVKVEKMQHGFMPDRSTVDAIFIYRRMHESYLEDNWKLSALLSLRRLLILCQEVIEWEL